MNQPWFGWGRAERGLTVRYLAARPTRWAAAWSFHPSGDPAAEDWVAVQALGRAVRRLHAGGHLHRHPSRHTPRRPTHRCARYLRDHEEYLRNDRALAAGWPIATGVIEGACHHLIADRLDITGARWGLHRTNGQRDHALTA